MNYCNAVLNGGNKSLIQPLQRCQNHAARTVTLTRKRSHITPVLKKLHWLPVAQRINFKILMLTYKALHGLAPLYLKDLLKQYSSVRESRRSQNQLRLVLPKVKKTFGERAFSYGAPRLWNALPMEIKNSGSLDIFKSATKTFLVDNPDFPPPLLK